MKHIAVFDLVVSDIPGYHAYEYIGSSICIELSKLENFSVDAILDYIIKNPKDFFNCRIDNIELHDSYTSYIKHNSIRLCSREVKYFTVVNLKLVTLENERDKNTCMVG